MAENGNKKNGENEKIVNAVFKVDVSCNCIGCVQRIKKGCYSCHGVSTVKLDTNANKINVSGIFDPVKLRDKLRSVTTKNVEILSPIPSKKDNQKDSETKQQNQKKKEPAVSTVVLKMAWHCQGCTQRIHKIISTYKGVEKVQMDEAKELITVKTTTEPKLIVEYLQKKFKRTVQIVPEKKEKEEQKQEGGKKKDCGGKGEKEPKLEYFMMGSGYGCMDASSGYVFDVFYPPQLFSDDNPNGCSIM